ncbi:GNAT family N-acetyltransferase [Ferrimonas sediminicola]|uniref:GNAT family N-acetyltransferase n=1 Tax=Ferrimonas sediminicola TaxID=2569538 RepID=A0A4V5NVF0_9GAMM|nr:GNAT family N-acetyltransferase [Ferrimonas sediminicola]TKB50293.1 GNAT family N-acetyltransferase [Ferrimonas sediminicola]
MNIHIRVATTDDAKAISRLIQPLTRKHVCPTCDESVHDALLASMSPQSMASYLSSNHFYVVAATHDNEIVGVAGIRDYEHLYHLFVDDRFQGQGLSRRLWDEVKAASLHHGNGGRFTVNSALNAERIYRHFGFQPRGGVRDRQGMRDIPMVLVEG